MACWQHRRPIAICVAALAATLVPAGMVVGPAGASASRTRPRASAPGSERFAADVTLSIAGQHIRVVFSGAAESSAAQVAIEVQRTQVVVRRIGNNLYVHLPASVHAPLPPGKTWGHLSLSAFERQAGIGAAVVSPSSLPSGPILPILSEISSAPPRKVGTGDVRGVPTTAYALDLDLAKLGAVLPASEAASLRQVVGAGKLPVVPVTVWVDGAGRLRQLRAAFPLTERARGITVTFRLTALVQVWDYGAPVRVGPPPAAEVAPLSPSFLSSGLGLGGLS